MKMNEVWLCGVDDPTQPAHFIGNRAAGRSSCLPVQVFAAEGSDPPRQRPDSWARDQDAPAPARLDLGELPHEDADAGSRRLRDMEHCGRG